MDYTRMDNEKVSTKELFNGESLNEYRDNVHAMLHSQELMWVLDENKVNRKLTELEKLHSKISQEPDPDDVLQWTETERQANEDAIDLYDAKKNAYDRFTSNAMILIKKYLTSERKSDVSHLKSPMEVMNHLEETYAGNDEQRIFTLVNEFYNRKFDHKKTINQNANELKSLNEELKRLEYAKCDREMIFTFLRMLPSDYDIDQRLWLSMKITKFDDLVKRAVITEKFLLNRKSEEKSFYVYQGQDRDKKQVGYPRGKMRTRLGDGKSLIDPKRCTNCGMMGHPTNFCKSDKKPLCFKCGRANHKADQCYAGNAGKQSSQKAQFHHRGNNGGNRRFNDGNNEDANIAIAFAAFGTRATIGEVDDSSKVWILDSGCSQHMSSNRLFFRDLRPDNSTKIKLADNMVLTSSGVGGIDFQADGGHLLA